MEIKNIILHFPWGAGGNFVRNCLLLDKRYEFDHSSRNTEERYKYLLDFYQQPTTSLTWLKNEWRGPRRYLYNTYYENAATIKNWSVGKNVIYLSHCQGNELLPIQDNILLDLYHVFLIPTNTEFISKIYYSKNPNGRENLQFTGSDINEEIKNLILTIEELKTNQIQLLEELKQQNKSSYVYNADRLFENNGFELILDIADRLSIHVPQQMVQNLHRIWINKTKFLYNNFFSNHPELSPTLLEWK